MRAPNHVHCVLKCVSCVCSDQILRCVIPVVCRINQTVRCTHISSNTTIYQVVCYLLYVKHNYMFRPQILAIFKLYNENLSIRYTCICRGCIGCRVGSVSARSCMSGGVEGLALGWLGIIYGQRTMLIYNYVQNGIHNNMS